MKTRKAEDPRDIHDERCTRSNTTGSRIISTQLRPAERTAMLQLGRFRVIRTGDLADTLYDGKQCMLDKDLHYLSSKGLVETRHVILRRDERHRRIGPIEVATLTRDGYAWLHTSGAVPDGQTVYFGFVKPREIEHDSLIYRAYRDAAARIENNGGINLRVKLDFEIKADLQQDIYRARKAAPELDMGQIRKEVAAKHDLPFVNGKVQIPDARIEFDRSIDAENREPAHSSRAGGHEDIEVLTAAYRRGHLRSKAQAGFRSYASRADRSSITAKIADEHDMTREILDL